MQDQLETFTVTLINGTHPVLRQNENGPCFIIALVNAILLSDMQSDCCNSYLPFTTRLIQIAKSPPPRTISIESVYSFIVEKVIKDPIEGENVDHSAANQLVDIMPMMDTGLLINLSFDNIKISDFNEYSKTIIDLLQQFDLNLYHAFLMPEDLILDLAKENIIKPTFDKCQDFLISHLDDEPKNLVALQLQSFLDSNKTEITQIGIQVLLNSIKDNTIFLFFRNDHFNTCLKHNGIIYSLVTDIGYSDHPDIVWLPLSINDEGDFLNADFMISKIDSNSQQPNSNPSTTDTEATLNENNDLLLAKQLQLEDDEKLSKNLQAKYDNQSSVTKTKTSQTKTSTPIPQTKKPTKTTESSIPTKSTTSTKTKSANKSTKNLQNQPSKRTSPTIIQNTNPALSNTHFSKTKSNSKDCCTIV
ncbi:hypothetical protein C6P40_001426 [Pichia californica]|uniref:MINDY deubiquitinase domain-containing protein n=1 Tax=Pichia californica TaxID=460514 RepID=A0A9P6WJ26_9ASCO|nr:hypothetical protein C6P40_001426 [[Candida] californica]